ncbi:nucleophile aminohydrolase [Pilobolus umbonatus]|nr:nucleophile aminohydrolase [Pilobolus umbonatus]
MTLFIAVHIGAGHLSRTKEPHYKSLCAMACEKAMELLKQNKPALEAVTAAIRVLEDDPLTNAGWGSNLTIEGTVECDASLMDGDGYFGAVGAVSGLKNPVVATRCMLEESKQGLLSLGRIPPMLLVGEGAKRWAEARGCETVESFVERKKETPLKDDFFDGIKKKASSYRVYQDHKKRLKEFEQSIDLGHDTVGAICIDGQGNIASGVSSGGISLKQPGRVGEAAMYGCGCWAQNETEDEPGIACSTSGTGEQIMKTMLTYKCAERLKTELDSAMKNTLQKDFLDSPFLKDYDIKSAGIIALRAQKSHHKTSNVYDYSIT